MDDFTDADWADYFGYSDAGDTTSWWDSIGGYGDSAAPEGNWTTPSYSEWNPDASWLTTLANNSGLFSGTSGGSTGGFNLSSLLGGAGGGFTSGGLLAAGLGALGGGLSSASSPTSTTTKSAPWEAQQPYLLDLFGKANSQLNSNDPLQTKSKVNYAALLGGPTNNPYAGLDNPYLTKAINNAQTDFMRGFQPLVNQANVQSGSFGNSGVAQTYGNEAANQLGKIDTSMRMQDYGAQQQLAENAVGRTANATQGTADFNFSPLKNYGSLITGQNFGSTSTTPLYNNTMGNVLGGALAGSSIYKNLFGGE